MNDHDRVLDAGDGREQADGTPVPQAQAWPASPPDVPVQPGRPPQQGESPQPGQPQPGQPPSGQPPSGQPQQPGLAPQPAQAAPAGWGTSPDQAPAAEPAAATPAAADLDHLASLVYERLAQRLGQHPDEPEDMPSVAEAVALRERAPELYDLWLKIAQDRAATGNYVQRAPYEVPERLAQSGRPRAVSSLVVVLAFCGYLAWLGGPGPYIAGLIAVADLIVMLGLFFGLRPEHLSGNRRPGRKPLPWPGTASGG